MTFKVTAIIERQVLPDPKPGEMAFSNDVVFVHLKRYWPNGRHDTLEVPIEVVGADVRIGDEFTVYLERVKK